MTHAYKITFYKIVCEYKPPTLYSCSSIPSHPSHLPTIKSVHTHLCNSQSMLMRGVTLSNVCSTSYLLFLFVYTIIQPKYQHQHPKKQMHHRRQKKSRTKLSLPFIPVLVGKRLQTRTKTRGRLWFLRPELHRARSKSICLEAHSKGRPRTGYVLRDQTTTPPVFS